MSDASLLAASKKESKWFLWLNSLEGLDSLPLIS